MPSVLLFLLLLLAGVALFFLGNKITGKVQLFFLAVGIVLILIGGYGTFTALI